MTPAIDHAQARLDLMTISDILSDPGVEEYLSGNRTRLAATRTILELFRIPFPGWAKRNVNGRSDATKAALARWQADNPDEARRIAA